MGEQAIRFCLHGPPVAWHRPKFTRSNRIDGRGTRAYKDTKDRAYQTSLALEATSAMMRWAHENGTSWDPDGEWHLDIEWHLPDLRRRDIDNLEKNVLDALTQIVYDDDAAVVSVNKTKQLNRDKPKTIVTVRKVHGALTE